MTDPRLHFPATHRNREPILAAMTGWLAEGARVLEIASGSGEHAAYFGQQRPDLRWQPSDREAENLASITAHAKDAGLVRHAAPIHLDAAQAETWPQGPFDAIFCANMIHIAPWEAGLGLLAGAGRVLRPHGALILYGPSRRRDRPTALSNEEFDASLKARDPRWGLRLLETVQDVAAGHGLALRDCLELPANNLLLRFLRDESGESA